MTLKRTLQKSAAAGAAVLALAGLTSSGQARANNENAVYPSAAAGASDEVFPRLEVEIDIEIQNDLAFDSDDDDAELNDLFTTTEPAIGLYLLPGLSIQAGLVLEPVEDPDPGDDRAFEDHGLFFEQLYMQYEQNAFSIYAGKFNLPFGVGWGLTPGVYGTDVAEDFYEQVERIGFGGSLTFGGAGIGGEGFGEHTFSAQTFFVDTTFLSTSALENRGRTRQADGGVSNTEDLSSFAFSLDGGELPGAPANLSYHLGLAFQEGGQDATDDETGIAFALYGSHELSEDLSIEPIAEYVYFDNAEGLNQERDILTLGNALIYGPWNLALAYSQVWSDPNAADVEDVDLRQFQVSAGYGFDFGLDVDVGYKFVDEETDGDSIETHFVGVILHYALDFTLPR